MASFYLMRHGSADYAPVRERGLIGGCLDWAPLTRAGVEEVELAVAAIKPLGVDVVLASPMTRALQTAMIVSRGLEVSCEVEFDLHEWLPDLTFRYDGIEAVRRAVAEREACGGEWPAGEAREWEPVSRVRQRVRSVLDRHTQRGRVLAVTHATVIEVLTRRRAVCAEVVELVELDALGAHGVVVESEL